MNRRPLIIGLGLAAIGLGGCVNVRTPEKPIEINLNVAIRQEVLVRMQQDVDALISSNPQAFPQAPGGTPTPTPTPAPAPARPKQQ